MRLVLMTYSVGFHDEVMAVLHGLGIRCYTRWREVEGQCSCGDARDGTQVWPGMNSTVMIVVDPEKARALLAALSRYNSGAAKEGGVDAYVVEVSDSVLAGQPG
jgi:hypothetical protein